MNSQVIKILKSGGVGILPTDTIYGIVGSALNKDTVERIYRLRRRSSEKPMIILISSIKDLEKFSINLTNTQKEKLDKYWPNSLSIILDCPDNQFFYLHRGTKTLAFRMPDNLGLLNLLKQTGPLVAPSANFEGEKYAETIEEAREYFKDNVEFYEDKGQLISEPSTLIRIKEDTIEILRQGKFKINE